MQLKSQSVVMEHDIQDIVAELNLLSASSDPELRAEASKFLSDVQASKQVWLVSRELLQKARDPQLLNLGSQMLYRRVRFTVESEEREELREFVYKLLEDAYVKYPRFVFDRLCATGALTGLRLMCSTWPTFIEDILQLAQKSDSTLVAAIQILGNIDSEITANSKIMEGEIYEIKDKLAAVSKNILEQLFTILKNSNNELFVEQTLFAIRSCVQREMRIQLLEHLEVIDVLLNAITVEKYFQIIMELLINAVINSQAANALNDCSLEEALEEMPQTTRTSIHKIIEFIAANLAETHLNQSTSQYSLYSAKITELINVIAINFSIFILENNDYSKVIIKLLLMCASHRNRKISYLTFDFWVRFRGIIDEHASDLLTNFDCSFITNAYMDILTIVMENCKRTSLPPASGKINGLKNTEFDELNQTKDENCKMEEEDETQLTFQDYRSEADHVFFSVYQVMQKLRGEEGVKEVLTKLTILLTQQLTTQIDTPEYVSYVTTCEAAIQAIIQMLNTIDLISKMNPCICTLIKIVVKLPEEEILTKAALQFLIECHSQVIHFVENETKFEVICYILSSVLKPEVFFLASKTFLEFTDAGGETFDHETLSYIANFIGTHFLEIDKRVCDSILQGVLTLSWKLKDKTAQIDLQKKVFGIVGPMFNKVAESITEENIGSLQITSDIGIIGTMLESLYKSLDQQEWENYKLLYETTVLPFVTKQLPFYLKFIQLLPDNNKFVELFGRILGLVVRICDIDLAPSYTDLISCLLWIFLVNPLKNSSILSTISDMIPVFDSLPQQQEWIKTKFADLNAVVIKDFAQLGVPDLIKHFIGLQIKVCQNHKDYYLNMPQFNELINLALEMLQKISDYSTVKEILKFLQSVFGSPLIKESKPALQKIPELIKCIFTVLPNPLGSLLVHVAFLLSGLVLVLNLESESLYQMMFEAINTERYKFAMDDKMKEIILKTLLVCGGDFNSMQAVLQCVNRIANYCEDEDWISRVEKIYTKKTTNQMISSSAN